MKYEKSFRDYYANQLLRLSDAEQEMAGFVDRLLGTVNHIELKQVLEKEKRLLEQERETVKRMYRRFGVEGEPERSESFIRAVEDARRIVDGLQDLAPDVRDLEIVALLQQLKAQAQSTMRALLTHAQEMGRTDDVREFQSMLQRENRSDEKLTNVARNNLYDRHGRTGEPRRPRG